MSIQTPPPPPAAVPPGLPADPHSPGQDDAGGSAKPFYKKKRWLALGGVGLIIAVAAGGAGSGQDGTTDEAISPVVADASSETDAPPPTSAEGAADATDGTPASEAPSTTEAPQATYFTSSRTEPYGFGEATAVQWDVFGDADESVWNTTIGAPVDLTDAVLAENPFNDPPAEGFVFAGFPVEMTLADAGKEPLSVGFNISFEIIGGASAGAHDGRCGVQPEPVFSEFAEVFVGGTLSGVVCVPVPADDLEHPDTQVALKFSSDSRAYFGLEGGSATLAPVNVVPFEEQDQTSGGRANPHAPSEPVALVWDVLGDADGSKWDTTVGPWTDMTAAVKAANSFNDDPADGFIFVGFPVEMMLLEATKEPLSVFPNVSFEVVGGASNAAHSGNCGVTPDGALDELAEVFVGGTISGTVCVPIAIEDLDDPNTRVALKFNRDSRTFFG